MTNSKIEKKQISLDKINLSKGKKDLLNKENKSVNRNVYLNEELSSSERGTLRRKRDKFINDILGKDRTDKERESAIQSFFTFYIENWKITDLKIESFTNSQKDKRSYKNCVQLLDYLNSIVE